MVLKKLYEQLYPQSTVSVSPFYSCSGRVSLCEQVIGSMLHGSSANSSSVIMAFWPSSGCDLSTIDYSRMEVGIVQCHIRHHVLLINGDSAAGIKHEHVLAEVTWKQKTPI